jgi:glycogen phosphorylase
MPKFATFVVVPKLPPNLERLRGIAYNLWWCWEPEAIELFVRIDRPLWEKTGQNPVQVLGQVSQFRLEALAKDDSFLAHLERVHEKFVDYMTTNSWWDKNANAPENFRVAYLSLEFGLQESISIYSGGLGVLAGDHLKSASDLGLPLVAVGLLYREGYFRQYLNADGWQQETYPQNDFYNIAVELLRDNAGNCVKVEVEYPERPVMARVWKCQVGRVPLYLLDSDFDENEPEGREITARLYGGDQDLRIRQEIMLGMGGIKALRAVMDIPTVFHMNEGHSAFMTLQRVRDLVVNEKLSFAQAREAVKSGSVFTTHTPVPAGNDIFPQEKIEHYFSKFCDEMGITVEQLMELGRQDPHDKHEGFCMTVLALKLSTYCNGVSKLHGEVARGMWNQLWSQTPREEVPITSISNGVHIRFWIANELAGLYDRYLGPGWALNPESQEVWNRIDSVPDPELWRTHERRRERLVNFARRRLAAQINRRGGSKTELHAAMEALDPEVVTVGFARRFATYKRADLFMRDIDRLKRILLDTERPLQIIIAGKAHPADNQGKELIRNIVHLCHDHDLRSHILFIEDYDINVARYLVQGVDCWLNTPRRPMEASGTSGMKAAANGGLNISVPDGWWCEAEGLGENGWSIGKGEMYGDPDEQDFIESEALYEILESEVVPMFYQRGRDGLPREWIKWMKNAIRTIGPVFNTNRMVQEYTDRFYLPATNRRNELRANNRERCNKLADWKELVAKHWAKVKVESVLASPTEGLAVGSQLTVTAEVRLGALKPDDVIVEIYYGDLNPLGEVIHGNTASMRFARKGDGAVAIFEGTITCDKTGQQGYTVRVIPSHPDLAQKHETMLIAWA